MLDVSIRYGNNERKFVTCSNFINSTGLIVDIIGAILLFRFGLPENINREGHSALLLEGTDSNEIEKAKKYDFGGKMGLLFLILGFVLQFASNFL